MIAYSTIVADPPWAQRTGPMSGGGMGLGFIGGQRASQPLAYPTMTLEQIKALPVGDLAAADAHLYVWATNQFLPGAFQVLTAWGFRYSTTLVWRKALMGGGLGGAWRINTEFVLFARRGTLSATGVVRGTCFDWKRPYGPPVKQGERRQTMHSVKPDEFQDLVESVSPGPYLELFARRRRLGWDVWGNEVESDVELEEAA